MILQDIYKSSGTNPNNIKNIVKAETLVIISQQDHLVNPISSIAFSEELGCKLLELTGDCGHSAPWCEQEIINKTILSFVKCK